LNVESWHPPSFPSNRGGEWVSGVLSDRSCQLTTSGEGGGTGPFRESAHTASGDTGRKEESHRGRVPGLGAGLGSSATSWRSARGVASPRWSSTLRSPARPLMVEGVQTGFDGNQNNVQREGGTPDHRSPQKNTGGGRGLTTPPSKNMAPISEPFVGSAPTKETRIGYGFMWSETTQSP